MKVVNPCIPPVQSPVLLQATLLLPSVANSTSITRYDPYLILNSYICFGNSSNISVKLYFLDLRVSKRLQCAELYVQLLSLKVAVRLLKAGVGNVKASVQIILHFSFCYFIALCQGLPMKLRTKHAYFTKLEAVYLSNSIAAS